MEVHTEGWSKNSAPLLAETKYGCHSHPRSEARFYQDIKHQSLQADHTDHVRTGAQLYIKHTTTSFLP